MTVLESLMTWARICTALNIDKTIGMRLGKIYLLLTRKLAREELSTPYLILIAFALWLRIEKIIRQREKGEDIERS